MKAPPSDEPSRPIRIVPFRADLAPAFAALNREWIERLFTIEPADLKTLNDPVASILDGGGAIFFALDGEIAVGTVAAVRDYRRRLRELVDGFIESMPLELPVRQDSPAWVILMGIEHERIHLETSSVIMRQMPLDELRTYQVPEAPW